MNLAGWVEKWGRAAPDRPAITLRRLDLRDLRAMGGAHTRARRQSARLVRAGDA